jgi:hypothetical protein
MAKDQFASEVERRDHDSLQTSDKSDNFAPADEDKEALDAITPGEANAPTPAVPPMKDGGTRAWLQVAGSFLVFGKSVNTCLRFFPLIS